MAWAGIINTLLALTAMLAFGTLFGLAMIGAALWMIYGGIAAAPVKLGGGGVNGKKPRPLTKDVIARRHARASRA